MFYQCMWEFKVGCDCSEGQEILITLDRKLNVLSSDIKAQRPEKVLGIMYLSPSRQTFLNTSVLDIVTDDTDGILLILLEQWPLILMPSMPMFVGALHQRCWDRETPRMLRQREKTEGKADYLRWIRVEVDDPGRKRGVRRKERKE